MMKSMSMKPHTPANAPRPASSALGHALLIAGDKWSLQIIRHTLGGARRFRQLGDDLQISDAVLSQRLTRLTADGILEARQYSTSPPRNEYVLTESGEQLWQTFVALWTWDRAWAPRVSRRSDTALRHLACGHLIAPVFGCGECHAIGVSARDVYTEVDDRLLLDVSDRRSRRSSANDVAANMDSTSVLADRWSTFILSAALQGIRRFSDFQEALGSISPVTLADRLTVFVENGMLARVPVTDGARRQEYRTTPKSLDFFPVFAALNEWAKDQLSPDGLSGLEFFHRAGDHLLLPRYTCNACNIEISRTDVVFEATEIPALH